MLGLKGHSVKVCTHKQEWEILAQEIITDLKNIFGSSAIDIQHIGSTAICNIKAKPIIDIAVGVKSLDCISDVIRHLEESGRYIKSHNRFSNDLLYIIYDENARTHQIHILKYDSLQWHNYVDFRDYLNAFPEIAYEYEKLKIDLAKVHSKDRSAYTDGKQKFMKEYLPKALEFAKNK